MTSVSRSCVISLTCGGRSPNSFDLSGHTGSKPGQQSHPKYLSVVWPVLYPRNVMFPYVGHSNLCCDWLFPGNPPSKPNKKTLKQRFLKLLPCYRSGSSSSSDQSKCQDTHVHHHSDSSRIKKKLKLNTGLHISVLVCDSCLWRLVRVSVCLFHFSLHPCMQEMRMMRLNCRQ